MADAYDDIEMRVGWGGCSLFLLALSVAVAVTLPWLIVRGIEWVRIAFLLVPGGALAGMAAGAIGMRRGSRRGFAMIGLVLNSTVVVSIVVAIAWAIWR